MINITPEYVAGFFDGEGSARVRKDHSKKSGDFIRVEISIANTNMDILKAIQAQYGGQIRTIKTAKSGAKPVHRIYWSSLDNASSFIDIVYPYVIGKKLQLNLLREYLSHHSSNSRSPVTDEDWALVTKSLQLNFRIHSRNHLNTPN